MGEELERRRSKGVFGPAAALKLGQWIVFHDRNGRGFAQPDAFLILPERIVVCEAKLTQTPWAASQLQELYEPLLWNLLRLPVARVQVFRNLLWEPPRMIECPSEAEPGQLSTWHWTR